MTTRSLPTTVALLVISLISSAASQCTPDCSNNAPGDKVEDPRNCTQFYVCVDVNEPSDHPVACHPPTSVFDSQLGDCVTGDSCVASCDAPACKLKCNGALDVISNPWYCNVFYYCDAALNPSSEQHCPDERPYFDGEVCGNDASVCCEVPCEPTCGPGDVQVPDPKDCTRFYVCLEEGTPAEESHFTCDPGETFQPSSSLCVLGGACYSLCEGTTTTTISTTTTTTIITTDSTTTSTTTEATTAPTTTTPESTTTEQCIAFLTCPALGYYPMCNTCQPGYFQCSQEGINGTPMLCPDGYAFNTNPAYPFCVLMDECPYTHTTNTTTTTTLATSVFS